MYSCVGPTCRVMIIKILLMNAKIDLHVIWKSILKNHAFYSKTQQRFDYYIGVFFSFNNFCFIFLSNWLHLMWIIRRTLHTHIAWHFFFLHCNDNLCKNVEFLLKLKELSVYASSSFFFLGGGVLFICISNTLKLHYITSFTGWSCAIHLTTTSEKLT